MYPLLREVTGFAEPGSDWWCHAQRQAGWAAMWSSDPAGALNLFTALREAAGREPSRALADALVGRSAALYQLGRPAEASEDGRRCLAIAREVGYPVAEAIALAHLASAAVVAGDLGEAVQLARQADQFPGDIPASLARACSLTRVEVLIQADDFAAAERVAAAVLPASRDAGDLFSLRGLLGQLVLPDLRAGRTGDATAHLREVLELVMRTGSWAAYYLDYCGHLCAATGRYADAVTAWAAYAALKQHEDWPGDVRHRLQPLRAARQALGPDQARTAEERGAAMSLDTAAEYALMLTEDPGPRSAEKPGPGKLSAREQELVTLVARGRTDAQIAAELYISIRTVRSHLDRIRDKTSCRRRADLTRLALAAGLI